MSATDRRFVLGIFVLGLAGVSAELLLQDHNETLAQAIPLLLAGLAVVSLTHVLVSGSVRSIRGFRLVMGLVALSGVVGSGLHVRASMEFQREMDPSSSYYVQFTKAVRAKAPPALAPGAMILLGLVGLLFTVKQPVPGGSS
jgi:hypothetical protein